MRTLTIFAVAILLATSFGSAPTARRSHVPANIPARDLARKAHEKYTAGQFSEARSLFENADALATEAGDRKGALKIKNNLANCYLVTFSYQKAMQTYLAARQIAEELDDSQNAAIASANIALIYGVMGDFERTVSIGEEVLTKLPKEPSSTRAWVSLHLGNSYHRLKKTERSDHYFRLAIEEAHGLKSPQQEAAARDHFGLALIDRGDLAEAAKLLMEAHAIRTASIPEDLALSNRSLGVLFARQGLNSEALAALTRAIESQRTNSRKTPIYELYAERARVNAASGNAREALADFRAALDYTRRWRVEVLPAGLLPAHWEGGLERLRSSFIHFAAEQAIQTRDSKLAFEALVAAEESRLASLRATTLNPGAPETVAYHGKVQALQTAEASVMGRKVSAEAEERIARLRGAVLDHEAELATEGQAWIPPSDPFALARKRMASLREGDTVLSFYLGGPASYRWELRPGFVRLTRLPDRTLIEREAKAFREAISASESGPTTGHSLYSQIFGEISREGRTSTVWTLVLDGSLFELPLAALPVDKTGSDVRYLVETRSIRIAPSLFLAADRPPERRVFVGIGDPVYNRADSRYRGSAKPAFELARLVGSGQEIDACARAFSDHAVILRGSEATEERLAAVLSQPVGVLHFATHFVRSAEDPSRTLIALGIAPGTRDPGLVGIEKIGAMGVRADLVVLSGCQSGAGQVIAGAGLMGLTRSWLAGGASGVAASLWPTPDDQGELFRSFYRHYASAAERSVPFAASTSLRAAQLDMLRSNGWRSSPRYWAAFFLMSKG